MYRDSNQKKHEADNVAKSSVIFRGTPARVILSAKPL